MRSGVLLSQIADGDSFFTSSGDPFNVIYSPILEDGIIRLVESGREDIATLINSYADQCDMSIILARLAAGDSSVLFARQGFYGDFSECTYNHAEMLQTVIDAHHYFDHLGSDIKAKFHDSFQEWFSTAGSPEWAKSMTSASSPASSGSVSTDPSPDHVASIFDNAGSVANSSDGGSSVES